MKPLASCTLYTFIDSAYLHGRDVTDIARQLCAGGSDLIQLRAKDWPLEKIKSTALRILPILRDHDVGLVINDHLSIAIEIGADLCHLGQEDFFDPGHTKISDLTPNPNLTLNPPPKKTPPSKNHPSSILLHQSPPPNSQSTIYNLQSTIPQVSQTPPVPQIGLSTHSPSQARRALSAGAHYIAIGPVFPTGTKPTARAVTLEYVRWAAANVPIPWFAIGGINLTNLDSVLAAGGTRICVVSAILNSPDITAACRQFKSQVNTSKPPSGT